MSLPIIDVPVYNLTVPSTGESIKFRPFLVKENKLLLLANETNATDSMYDALVQIIVNCTFGKVAVEKLALFDLQYIFLKIRSKSIGEVADFSIECEGCKEPVQVEMNLDSIEIQKNPLHNPKVLLSDSVGVMLKSPTIGSEKIIGSNLPEAEKDVDFAISCIDYIFDKETIYHSKDTPKAELKTFIESLSSENYNKIKAFFETLPKIHSELNYKCPKCSKEGKIVIDNIRDFFE